MEDKNISSDIKIIGHSPFERKPHLTREDWIWLNSRGDSNAEDITTDQFGRKHFRDYDLPISGRSSDEMWGRTYLPIRYQPRVTETSALKIDPKTGEFYELR